MAEEKEQLRAAWILMIAFAKNSEEETVDGDPIYAAYMTGVKIYDILIGWEDTFALIAHQVKDIVARSKGDAAIQDDHIVTSMTGIPRFFEAVGKFLNLHVAAKEHLRERLFDRVCEFDREHPETKVSLPFPDSYEFPPRVTLASMKVCAHG
ncbi:hypothetical protein N0V90_006234 [Kalmusia sp. IMI 367209]|nr:hypothetical protein N0V90_006234 [Kalmusia sp. IMI 367209]